MSKMRWSDRVRRRLSIWQGALTRYTIHGMEGVAVVANVLLVVSVIASIACLAILIIRTGYDHNPHDLQLLHRGLRWCQGVFVANVGFNLLFNLRNTLRRTRTIKWIVDVAVLITVLPWVYPHPANPWIGWLATLLYSNKFLYCVLAAYSIVAISYALFRMVGRRTNPSLLLSGSFIVFILLGSFLLMLPKCTYGGIDYVDSLFVSTSAVSITGLTTVDVPSTFTPLGTLILAILIQIGALGVLTFTSFFALFFSGSASIYSQLMLKDMIYSKNMSSLIPTLLYILTFTLVIEAIGAVMIFASIHGTLGMDLRDEVAFSAFHAVSAFCNAGFSTLPDGLSNPLLLNNNISIYWVMSLIIISGSIGFPILVNFRDALAARLGRLWKRGQGEPRSVHLFNMNTKIVLTTFALLTAGGAVMFYILEYHNTLEGMTQLQKVTQSVFNSATPRSAGFSSVGPAGFMNVTLVMVLFLMWIGGASQSTGGGIKVNTFAAICLNLRAILTGASKATAYHRTIATGSIRRANAVVAISIVSYLVVAMTMLGLEHQLPARAVLFESCSALFTVGSSLGITPMLGAPAKVVLCVAMFVGRVGLISLLTGLVKQTRVTRATYPADNIIIN